MRGAESVVQADERGLPTVSLNRREAEGATLTERPKRGAVTVTVDRASPASERRSAATSLVQLVLLIG